MSQTKTAAPSKIRISNKNPGNYLTGANTLVELDGQLLSGVTFLKVELKPGKLAKVTVEMVVDIDCLEIDANLKLTGQKQPVKIVRTISKFESDVVV